MAKKFGKILLATAAIGTAAAYAYYYLQKKETVSLTVEHDDDFDDFSTKDEEAANYVPLTPQTPPAHEASQNDDVLFTETTTQDCATQEAPTEENVEEFFNDEPIN